MSISPAPTLYRALLPLPSPVNDFFAILREFGTICGVSEAARGGVTLYLTATGEADATRQSLLLGQRLGAAGLAPAFPATHVGGGFVRVPSYRWEFDTPLYAGNGQWAILVALTADLHHLLGLVSGLGAWAEDFRGEPNLPITLYPDDLPDLVSVIADMEHELDAWFGEPVRLSSANDEIDGSNA